MLDGVAFSLNHEMNLIWDEQNI